MGNLMGLWRDGKAGYNYFIDFEREPHDNPPDLEPGEDTELYESFCSLTQRGEEALRVIRGYEGTGDVIRQAMGMPQDLDLQARAFTALRPNVDSIRGFYNLARDLEQAMPRLLVRLTRLPSLMERPSLVRKLADVLQLVLQWDQLKMMRPQIQNDFAYYRRLLPKMLERGGELVQGLSVRDVDANVISMFIAENVPLTVMMATVTAQTAHQEPGVARVVATVANMCCGMVHRGIYSSDSINRKLLMAMTSAVVLYDRITDAGVFVKHSGVGVSMCIKVLRKHGGPTAEQMRNCLKYATKHYNSETTPRNIRTALDAS